MLDEYVPDCLTFDDVLLVPAYTGVLPAQVDVRIGLTSRIRLNIPIPSAAMYSVMESDYAIAMDRAGGCCGRYQQEHDHGAAGA